MTKLELCNAAILRLGSSPITSLDDNTKRAKLCKLEYERVKADLISNHPWRFSLKRVILDTDLGPDLFGVWGSSFDLPSDYYRAYRVEMIQPEYTIEGNILYANTLPVHLQYMAEVDEDDFRSYFNEVIILKLALDLSYNLIQSNEVTSRLQEQYERALSSARTYNAQEASPHDFVIRDWADSRL